MRTFIITALAFLIGCIMLSIVLPVQAMAGFGTWAKFDNWVVFGDSDAGICQAMATYETGRNLHVLFSNDGVSLAVSNIEAVAGQRYTAMISASTGETGIMEAIGAGTDIIVFSSVNQVTIRALANAKFIGIQGLGTFELTGSKKAMASAWECFEALNSI